MARFQALTNRVLEQELASLRVRLGLATSQKADLLRELASIASWVLSRSAAGSVVEARHGEQVEALQHPAVERLRAEALGASFAAERIALDGPELTRLARLLGAGFAPTPGLLRSLKNLADSDRRPPEIEWRERPSSPVRAARRDRRPRKAARRSRRG